jgi:ketol-acid reductoisomerase
MPHPTFLRASDAPPDALAGERVAVLGYGNLGRTAALNLRDSGAKVRIGNREDDYAVQAREEGFEVVAVEEASKDDVVFILLPDEVIPDVFARAIGPNLQPGAAIAFGSGYNVAYKLIAPPPTVDVLLVAPRMAGETARGRYLSGEGFWAYVGVEHDASGKGRRRMLGLAAGLGALRAGCLEMTAEMEALIDLYIEQSVGPLLGAAVMIAFTVGREGGIPAEALVLEMYMSGEMETVWRAFREVGFYKAAEVHGPTALFGGTTRMMEIDKGQIADRFQAVLEDIRKGGFARRFQEEAKGGYPMLEIAKQMIHEPSPIAEAEDRLRAHVAGK